MIHALKRIKSYLDYGMPQAIQIGAIAALRGPQDCVEENCAIYKERRDALIDGLAAPGEGQWKIEKPLATMFVWAPIPEPWASLGSLEFSKRLLEGVKKLGLDVAEIDAKNRGARGYVVGASLDPATGKRRAIATRTLNARALGH